MSKCETMNGEGEKGDDEKAPVPLLKEGSYLHSPEDMLKQSLFSAILKLQSVDNTKREEKQCSASDKD